MKKHIINFKSGKESATHCSLLTVYAAKVVFVQMHKQKKGEPSLWARLSANVYLNRTTSDNRLWV